MYLRKTIYQMSGKLKRIISEFPKSHKENLVSMVVGIAYGRSVGLRKIAENAPMKDIQIESRVQRFERMLDNKGFKPQLVLEPIAKRLLKSLSSKNKKLTIVMDRSMIEDKLNLLHIAVAFQGRALPIGWLRVESEATSNLALQKQLLEWLAKCLPQGTNVTIVADREFHSIKLATLIKEMGWHFVLRIQSRTQIYESQQWQSAKSLAYLGLSILFKNVQVARYSKTDTQVNFIAHWDRFHDEAWLLISDLSNHNRVISTYAQRFWIEEMFSDQKSRGLNLEKSRITDPDRLQRLLTALVIAYLWVMQLGSYVVDNDFWRYFDNKGADRTLSFCQLGLSYLTYLLYEGINVSLFNPDYFVLNEG